MKPSRRRYFLIVLCILFVLCLTTLGTPIKSSALPRAAPSDAGFLGSFPDYDSGWEDIAAGTSETFAHSLGGNTDDYVVSLMFRRPGGAHHLYFGGDWYRDKVEGAYWHGLTTAEINVERGAHDGDAEQVRVRI